MVKFTFNKLLYLVLLLNVAAYSFLFTTDLSCSWESYILGIAAVSIVCIIYIVSVRNGAGDTYLLLLICMLLSIGLLMILRLSTELAIKQVVWAILGTIVFFLTYYMYTKIREWDRFVYVYIFLPVALYLATLVFGKSVNGALNWITIGGIGFQPSELNKVLFIFFLASYFQESDDLFFKKIHQNKKRIAVINKVLLMLVVYMNIGFLVIQKELGTAVLLFLVFIILLYVFGKELGFFLLNSALIIPGIIFAYVSFYHVRVRVEAWVDPWADITDKGYQITQSLFAIASGGVFGTGIGMGSPGMIPIVSTDFIFSAICEEIGMFGGVAIILLYMIFIYRGIKIMLSIKNRFNRVLGFGAIVTLGLQAFIIIGGVIKLIPLTGITLPFISYGGSSLVVSFIIFGIIQAISQTISASKGDELDV